MTKRIEGLEEAIPTIVSEYIDPAGVKHDYIYLLMEDTNGYLKGWYFSDEVSQLNGPFGSLEEAEMLLQRYCVQYLGLEEV